MAWQSGMTVANIIGVTPSRESVSLLAAEGAVEGIVYFTFGVASQGYAGLHGNVDYVAKTPVVGLRLVRRPLRPSFLAVILTEMYLRGVCSCQEINNIEAQRPRPEPVGAEPDGRQGERGGAGARAERAAERYDRPTGVPTTSATTHS
jgi:hypothetical protein